MAYVVPASAGVKAENRFEFTIGDETFSVPFLQYLNAEAVEYLESPDRNRIGEITFIRRLITLADEKAGAAVRPLARDQVKGLSEAWAKASEVTEGESSASDDS